MSKPFLRSVAEYIFNAHKDNAENVCIVLPNKRGALFLKDHLAKVYGKTMWLPSIISAEELIGELSGLRVPEEIDLICHLYESYKVCYGEKAETFDSFAKWGQLILQDFNEIDRYLADPQQLYENLKDIKVIENWSLGEEKLTEYQTNYLKFMSSLGVIYKHYSAFLLANNMAYQGLAYRVAVDRQETSRYTDQFSKLIFCGFNALNAAELKIFGKFYKEKKAEILWDADEYYLKNENQEAGMFLRKNLDYFGQPEPVFIERNFKNKKDIRIISVPKQMGQAQVVKQSIQKLIDEKVPLDRVAVVLANEKLLWPVLQQLPHEVEHVNITMEYPLKYSATYGFIELLIQVQTNFAKQKKQSPTIYHHDLLGLLRQPLMSNYLKGKELSLNTHRVINEVKQRNLTFITQKNLQQLLGENYEALKKLFSPVASVVEFTETVRDFIETTIDYFSEHQGNNRASLELEYLYIILKNFNRLTDILGRYPHFNDLNSFRQLFSQIVGNSTAPFIGEPLKGLQIMGVLETRTLDFDHVILVSVNEGVLPSGKSINSFIPNDLKRAFGLPLYLEKDAIYAYHFYRLLQKASDIVITYDSETDTFGKGEKSRFVTQLQLEMKKYNPEISVTEEVALYKDFPVELPNTILIHKNETVLNSILEKAKSNDKYGGLSPSGLTTFKECSLKFYFRYGAHLKETKEVEENAEANTFGSILHLSLEQLYKNFEGRVIGESELKEQLKLIDTTVNESFISFFDHKEPVGKNLLQQEVIKVYVKKLVNNDLRFISSLKEQNQFLTLNYLEKEFTAPLEVNVNNQTTTLYIKGKMDRMDSFGGMIRIIDYKSSVKNDDKFLFEGYEPLFENKGFNKQLQLFIYAWLVYKNKIAEPNQLLPCIIPFKVFNEEPKYIVSSDKKPLVLTKEFLNEFEQHLKGFVESIFNDDLAFVQTHDADTHEFCPYNAICNFK